MFNRTRKCASDVLVKRVFTQRPPSNGYTNTGVDTTHEYLPFPRSRAPSDYSPAAYPSVTTDCSSCLRNVARSHAQLLKVAAENFYWVTGWPDFSISLAVILSCPVGFSARTTSAHVGRSIHRTPTRSSSSGVQS
jgi:hypothetical protein